jgi:hypothetical protein
MPQLNEEIKSNLLSVERQDYLLFKFLLLIVFISSINLKTRGFSELTESPVNLYNLNRVIGTILIVFLPLLFLIKNQRMKIRIPKVLVYFLFYAASGAIGTILNATYIGYSAFKLAEVFAMIILGTILFTLSSYCKQFKSISEKYSIGFLKLIHLVILANLLLLGAKSFIASKDYNFPGRLTTRFPPIAPNEIGFFAISLFFYEIIKKEEKTKPIWIVLSITFLILSIGRAAILSFVLGLIYYAIFLQKKFLKKAIVMISMILIIAMNKNILFQYLMRGESEYSITTLSGRIEYWTDAIQHFKTLDVSSKIFGSGFAIGVRKFVMTYAGEEGTSFDNDLVNALFSGGIIGAFFLLLLYVRLLLLSQKLHKKSPYYILLAIAIFARGFSIANFSVFNLLLPFIIIWLTLMEIDFDDEKNTFNRLRM